MLPREGLVNGINGNMISVRFEDNVRQSEVAFIISGKMRLKAEVVRIRGKLADLQIFESSRGLKVGGRVEFTGELLSVELGPGLLGRVFDGLQNPLIEMVESYGSFLEPGAASPALSRDEKWMFMPGAKKGDILSGGDVLGTVKEHNIDHKIMVPFFLAGPLEVLDLSGEGERAIDETIAVLKYGDGKEIKVGMSFNWPVKKPVTAYEERIAATERLLTRIRIIDTLFPVALGGTYCIPGPFGAGKTVLQQITSRNAMVDVVIIAACGERAGEVVETIREFPKIVDSTSGRSLMERTIIVCNTSSMPVAARESSVYTAVTMAEYYRQMGLNVLLLADSTSRWAQAMRERSGRLEEIPGEEAFPAYLESVIADFYERAGVVRLKDGSYGSVTIGGTISPAGGFFEEPVTQATLKVAGAFHGLSRERSDARRFPAIEPLQSWSRYEGVIDRAERQWILTFLKKANEIEQMMKVVGEEGTSIDDYLTYLKGDLFDSVYLQQNAFHEVDAASSESRQISLYKLLREVMNTPLKSSIKDGEKEEAKRLFFRFRQLFLDLNFAEYDSELFITLEEGILSLLEQTRADSGERLTPDIEEAFVETKANSKIWRDKRIRRFASEPEEADMKIDADSDADADADRERDEEDI